jgi:hypothetical protein
MMVVAHEYRGPTNGLSWLEPSSMFRVLKWRRALERLEEPPGARTPS